MRTLSLPIAGMTCDGCAAAATKAIAAVPGVKAVRVSLAAARAEISADERASETALVAAVERAGFTVAPSTSA
jgi:copper chaperone CopZ